jgi:hypothetical protein
MRVTAIARKMGCFMAEEVEGLEVERGERREETERAMSDYVAGTKSIPSMSV